MDMSKETKQGIVQYMNFLFKPELGTDSPSLLCFNCPVYIDFAKTLLGGFLSFLPISKEIVPLIF